MDLIHTFLNLAAPPFTVFTIALFLPPFLLLKFFLFVFRSLYAENVAGKAVLITGASSGIGEHLAYEYAARGARLALAARRENKLQEVANVAHELGSPDVMIIRADVSKVNDCKRMVDEAVNRFGQLDHLVNNAGLTSVGSFEESTDVTNLRPVMETNFWGSVYTTRFAIPHLRSSGGKIIAIASMAGLVPTPRMSFYSASKAAVISLYETLRVEVGADVGITIVTPGFIESEMTQGKFLTKEGQMGVDQELRDALISVVPVERVDECARAIVDGACRGDRCLAEPPWVRAIYCLKVFFPEAVEWFGRALYGTDGSAAAAPGRRILDLTGAKRLLYPSSIRAPPSRAD